LIHFYKRCKMVLTKQYLRYVPKGLFNLVGSGRGGAVFLDKKGELAAVAAAQDVVIWDLKKKERLRTLPGTKHEVTSICVNETGILVAVGYNDGSIKLFDSGSGESEVTFTGHKSAVNSLAFDQGGLRLVSGSQDTNIIVWDIVSESGLYRLHGHKGPVTAVKFMKNHNIIVSSSKDTYVKFWDLTTQHCFKTLTGHVTEIWDLVLVQDDSLLVTGGSDAEIKIWKIDFKDSDAEVETGFVSKEPTEKKVRAQEDENEETKDDDEDDNSILSIKRVGSILRSGEGRLQNLATDRSNRIIAAHGSDKTLELFLVCTEDEIQKRLAKKAKKEKKRTGADVDPASIKPTVQEQFKRIKPFKVSGKVRSVDVEVYKRHCRVLMVLGNNQVEVVDHEVGGEADVESLLKLETPGHRSDVRTLSFSSDNTAILTASSEGVKVWNRSSLACVRTMHCAYALSSLFAPGDRHALVGTKSGKIQIFDISSGDMTEEISAHDGEVWSLVAFPDTRGLVSGSGDKTVKFWDYELVSGTEGTKVLSIVHKRSLQLDEGVTCISLSADGRLIAVGLLDSTVKIFFVDTLKFFLSLYGHKLPVVCMDISSDSTIIATGSADRNMKIWGLDFGDCHKSVFAHDDTMTGLQFIHNTHMVFTCGKDGEVKQWDADNFQRILTLKGHLGEVWSLGISPNGKWVASSGKDRSVRLWEKTSEILVLDDERETERDVAAEELAGDSQPVPGEQGKETSLPSKRNAETERGAEALMEAVQLYHQTIADEGDQLPPLMLAYNAESPLDFMCGTVCRLKSSQLEETLLVLPLDVVQQLLDILLDLLTQHREVELVTRCLLFLLEIHHGPILANKSFEQTVIKLSGVVGEEVSRVREMTGTNLAGLRFLATRIKEKEDVELFADATLRVREKNKKKKKKEKALQRAVMSL